VVGVLTFLRAHLNSVIAVLLAGAYVAETSIAEEILVGPPLIDVLETTETLALSAGVVFLLSLALRVRLPLIPLALAYVALLSAGQGQLEDSYTLLIGLGLLTYSVAAWTVGPVGLVGALGVGGLVGLAVIRLPFEALEAQDVAVPALLLVGPWTLGLAARSVRIGRDDPRLVGDPDWEAAAGAPDSPGRDEIVRDIRDIVERSMSVVVMQSRSARESVDRDPGLTREALGLIEAASSEALSETQRLTGLLLSPDGTPLPEPQPGLADLDFLAAQVTNAGLPVDMRVEGRPLPLTSDLDAVAYRVVHQALMSTLEHATASQSHVIVRYEVDEIQLEITDDGLSTGEENVDDETAGLAAVRDEVAAMGGSLDAGPTRGGGYWVMARLPIEPDAG
jgi:signal transduction histidine kinase